MPKFTTVLGVSALVLTSFVAGFILSKRYEDDFESFDEPSEPETDVRNITVTPEDINPPYVSKYYSSPEEMAAKVIPGYNGAVKPREDKQYKKVVYQYQQPVTPPEHRDLYKELLSERSLDPDFSQDAVHDPRVISVNEYFNDMPRYEKVTVTWYEGDSVLTDQDDAVVEEFVVAIGEGNLLFGHDSGDPNVVYVRNDRLSTDYEVVRSEGSYRVDVLGLD
jgi:hypothetical protein